MVERWPERRPACGQRSLRTIGGTLPFRAWARGMCESRASDVQTVPEAPVFVCCIQPGCGRVIRRSLTADWGPGLFRITAVTRPMAESSHTAAPDLRIRGPSRQAAAAAARRGFGFPGTGRDGWEGPERAWPSIREPGLPELRKGDGREARRHRDTLHVDHLNDVSPSGSVPVRARQARAGAQSDR